VIKLAAAFVAAALTLAFPGVAPAASKIEPIVSPGGIKAWLVREQSVPMVALDFALVKDGAPREEKKS
jgi:zinc protease